MSETRAERRKRVLLPCPFCGSDEVRMVTVPRGVYATCGRCRAESAAADSQALAIAAWNQRRPTRAAIRAEVLREVASEWALRRLHLDAAIDLRERAEKEERDGK